MGMGRKTFWDISGTILIACMIIMIGLMVLSPIKRMRDACSNISNENMSICKVNQSIATINKAYDKILIIESSSDYQPDISETPRIISG